MSSITIKCGNVFPSSFGVDIDSIISGWLEVDEYFTANDIIIDQHKIELTIDSSPIRKKLQLLKTDGFEAYMQKEFKLSETKGIKNIRPLGGDLYIEIKKMPSSESWNFEVFLKHLLELLFLALNVSRKGGCNYASFSIGNEESKSSLYSSSIEASWELAEKDNWPKLIEIPFTQVWRWMEKNNGLNFILANTDATKAMAVLLHQSYNSDIESTDVVQLSQVLESFYLKKGEPKARGLIRKIPVVLGEMPIKGMSWIKEFYKLRSDIVHGDFPLFRPQFNEEDESFNAIEEYYWKLSQAIDRGISVTIGTLQDLIVNDASKYVFEEKITVNVN